LVDEDPAYRWDTKHALELDPGLQVVAEAGNGHEALALTDAHRPDLVLIGRRLPGLTGVQVGAAIRYHHPGVRVLLLVPIPDYDQCLTAIQAGAAGILPRYGDQQHLRTALRTVVAGNDLVQPWLSGVDVATLAQPTDPAIAQKLVGILTPREFEAFDCLLMGLSTKETGAALGIADQTVKNRISAILHKLRLGGRMGAVRLALSHGWADYGPDPHVVSPIGSPNSRATDRLDRRVPPTVLTLSGEETAWA
jgi:two-component system response regulator DegU